MSCEHTSAVLGTASQNNSICRAHTVRALGHEMQHDALTLSSPRFVCRVTDYRDASAHIIHLFGAAGCTDHGVAPCRWKRATSTSEAKSIVSDGEQNPEQPSPQTVTRHRRLPRMAKSDPGTVSWQRRRRRGALRSPTIGPGKTATTAGKGKGSGTQ